MTEAVSQNRVQRMVEQPIPAHPIPIVTVSLICSINVQMRPVHLIQMIDPVARISSSMQTLTAFPMRRIPVQILLQMKTVMPMAVHNPSWIQTVTVFPMPMTSAPIHPQPKRAMSVDAVQVSETEMATASPMPMINVKAKTILSTSMPTTSQIASILLLIQMEMACWMKTMIVPIPPQGLLLMSRAVK